ncbi:MAG: hypothetical protein Q8Q60_03805 [Candidatus Chromulinivorax sp.]|nr:hypothetical protein [Candidatus Chromulinivorax sp.]
MNQFLITTMCAMSFVNLLLGDGSNPIMSRVYANQYTPAIQQTQNAGSIGTLVPTGIFGINGSLSVAPQVPNSQVVAMQVLSTGMLAVVCNDGTNSYMVEYTSSGAVSTDFASGSGNIVTLAGLANASLSMTLDEQNRFLISGADDGSSLPWIRRITSSGIVDTTFVFTDGASWTSSGTINQLATQTSGKIIAVGCNGTHAMIARYNLNGSIDPLFGARGYIIFNGAVNSGGTLPTSTGLLNNAIIDAQNNIYVAYVDATLSVYVTRFTAAGTVDFSWNSGNPVNISYLDGSSMVAEQLHMILDSVGDLIVAVPSGSPTVIKAASIQSATGAAGTFADFITSGGVFAADNYALFNMMATSDGSVYFLGSDTTTQHMAIIRCTSLGVLDTSFNNTGINFFYPSGSMPSGYANINTGVIATDGQIFVGGAQLDTGITTPYISSFYNNQYVTPVAQFPKTQEQGTIDISFGSTSTETHPGIVSPFVGLYRSSLQQKAESVTELLSGNLVIGMNGYTGVAPLVSNMILIRLLPTGDYDGTFGCNGQLILPNLTNTNEYITNVVEDGSANLYVTGYSDLGAIFRKYTADGMLLWNSDYLVAGYQALGCGFEGINRILLFLGGPSGTGQINGYLVADGAVDISFHSAGSSQGELLTTDFCLNMGPLYNGIVDILGTIFVAYKDTVTNAINVAAIFNGASNVTWITLDVFSTTLIDADNIRVAFNKDGNVIVAASTGTDFLVTVLNLATGCATTNYPTPLVISCGSSVQLRQVIGISDNTIVLVGYNGTGGAMLAVRINATGAIDITFDCQGPFPGVASIQISNQITNYYARVASGITVQSHTGSNQGNLIMSGYEQMFASDATPVVLRIFGEPGTTQVKSFPVVAQIPGTFDVRYNGTGIAENYVLGALTSEAYQEVRAIRQLVGTQIMTIVTDNTTSISYLQRLNADSSIDTTYGDGLGIPILKLSGTETVQSMVFDGAGNFLVTGSNSISGGYIKRILPDGTVDQLFGGSTTSPSFPVGTVYGLMDTIHACQQLTNGNIVIVGSTGGAGVIKMLNSTGELVSSFGTGGQVTNGLYATSVSVDPLNNLYVSIAYMDGSHMNARILKLHGNGQPASFGIHGAVDAAIVNIDNAQSLRLVFDTALRPIVAASCGGSSGQLAVNRCTADGLVDTTFNGGVQTMIPLSPTTNVIVTGLVALQDDKILISGYQQHDSIVTDNQEFIACLDSLGVVAGSFGSGITPGLVTFQVADSVQLARRLIDMNVQSDGNILLCGGEIPASNQETPLTFRCYGYPNIQAVPQFTGYQASAQLPSVFNVSFNGTGISATPEISNLSQVGNVVIDSLGHALIGGVTSTGLFVIARYLKNGLLDTIAHGGTGFGVDGIAISTNPISGLFGGKIAVDEFDNIYIGGIAASDQLIVARFTSAGILDILDFGAGGIAASIPITNLFDGGFVAIDSENKPLVSGYTSDGKIVATKFLFNGATDTTFAAATSYVASITIPSLLVGGSIVTDDANNVYLGGMTSTYSMFVIKLNSLGVIHEEFGTDGIASTSAITGLVDGGAIALGKDRTIAIGGLTAHQTFVIARFLPTGQLDPIFNTTGIAYSNPVDVLNIFGNIGIDSNNDIVVGGTASNYDRSKSIIVARFTSLGVLDTVFSSVGMATTGTLSHLLSGGFVGTDRFDNVFVGGLTDVPGFVMSEMYSGKEIFVTNLTQLNPVDLKTYYYRDNPEYLIKVVSPSFYVQSISDTSVRQAVLTAIVTTLQDHIITYSGQQGWNLVWHAYRESNQFDIDRAALVLTHADSADEINSCFANLQARILALKIAS